MFLLPSNHSSIKRVRGGRFDPEVEINLPAAKVKGNQGVETGQEQGIRDLDAAAGHIYRNIAGAENILGIADGEIVAVTEDIEETTINLVAKMVDEESELITLFYGEDVTADLAEKIAGKLEEQYPDFEIELHSGGQPLYYFIIAIE